jgi:hypothetical protein
MQKFVKLPFLFLFIAGCMGVLFRWHFINPFSWLKFPYWLHAHSHLMFLGWVFNLLSLAYIKEHIAAPGRKKYVIVFLVIQVSLVGMLLSFPLQGYGLYSILFSTLHTILVGIWAYWFFKETNLHTFNPSLWFARISLVLFFISSLEPFSLGPLVVSGQAHSQGYYFAVYFYLHFQYNGVFTFGVFSLLFGLLQHRGIMIEPHLVKRVGYLMFLSCFPAYFLSTLWAKPGLIFNLIGLTAALTQLVALIYFLKIVSSILKPKVQSISTSGKILFTVALLSFILKLILQVLSAHPYLAQLAYEVRNYVMAYLHLVLLGMITSFLLAWCIEKGWINEPGIGFVLTYVSGFVGMEMVLISTVFWFDFSINPVILLFGFSSLLVIGIAGFLRSAMGPSV